MGVCTEWSEEEAGVQARVTEKLVCLSAGVDAGRVAEKVSGETVNTNSIVSLLDASAEVVGGGVCKGGAALNPRGREAAAAAVQTKAPLWLRRRMRRAKVECGWRRRAAWRRKASLKRGTGWERVGVGVVGVVGVES